MYILCSRYTVKNHFIGILGPVLNHFFLILEKPIAHMGNVFAQSRKDLFFLHPGFSPQRCNPGNLEEDSLLERATKIQMNFQLGRWNIKENSLCTHEQCCQLFGRVW
jgi:hypothetical protein